MTTFEKEFQKMLKEMRVYREQVTRERMRDALAVLPLFQAQMDFQKDAEEYEEEMSLGGRPYRVHR